MSSRVYVAGQYVMGLEATGDPRRSQFPNSFGRPSVVSVACKTWQGRGWLDEGCGRATVAREGRREGGYRFVEAAINSRWVADLVERDLGAAACHPREMLRVLRDARVAVFVTRSSSSEGIAVEGGECGSARAESARAMRCCRPVSGCEIADTEYTHLNATPARSYDTDARCALGGADIAGTLISADPRLDLAHRGVERCVARPEALGGARIIPGLCRIVARAGVLEMLSSQVALAGSERHGARRALEHAARKGGQRWIQEWKIQEPEKTSRQSRDLERKQRRREEVSPADEIRAAARAGREGVEGITDAAGNCLSRREQDRQDRSEQPASQSCNPVRLQSKGIPSGPIFRRSTATFELQIIKAQRYVDFRNAATLTRAKRTSSAALRFWLEAQSHRFTPSYLQYSRAEVNDNRSLCALVLEYCYPAILSLPDICLLGLQTPLLPPCLASKLPLARRRFLDSDQSGSHHLSRSEHEGPGRRLYEFEEKRGRCAVGAREEEGGAARNIRMTEGRNRLAKWWGIKGETRRYSTSPLRLEFMGLAAHRLPALSQGCQGLLRTSRKKARRHSDGDDDGPAIPIALDELRALRLPAKLPVLVGDGYHDRSCLVPPKAAVIRFSGSLSRSMRLSNRRVHARAPSSELCRNMVLGVIENRRRHARGPSNDGCDLTCIDELARDVVGALAAAKPRKPAGNLKKKPIVLPPRLRLAAPRRNQEGSTMLLHAEVLYAHDALKIGLYICLHGRIPQRPARHLRLSYVGLRCCNSDASPLEAVDENFTLNDAYRNLNVKHVARDYKNCLDLESNGEQGLSTFGMALARRQEVHIHQMLYTSELELGMSEHVCDWGDP
ncbi:hypothetical protein EV715DRAFT_268513 [Schizophyllum commune]